MKDKLKSKIRQCKHCGNKKINTRVVLIIDQFVVVIECLKCNNGVNAINATDRQAIRLWNRTHGEKVKKNEN